MSYIYSLQLPEWQEQNQCIHELWISKQLYNVEYNIFNESIKSYLMEEALDKYSIHFPEILFTILVEHELADKDDNLSVIYWINGESYEAEAEIIIAYPDFDSTLLL